MKPITDEKLIDEVLNRGIEAVYPTKEELKKKLMSGEKIKLYCGFDPQLNHYILVMPLIFVNLLSFRS